MKDKRLDDSLWFQHEKGHLLYPWYRRSGHHSRSAFWVSDGSNLIEDADPIETIEDLVVEVFQRRRSVWLRAKGSPALSGLYRFGEQAIKGWSARPDIKSLVERAMGGPGSTVIDPGGLHARGEVLPRTPVVWRLIAHHESPREAMESMIASNVMAIGWTDIGDLDRMLPSGSGEISQAIRDAYPELQNTGPGGASLWRLFRVVAPGDLVIVSSASSRAFVLEVMGDYFYSTEQQAVLGYRHQRAAALTDIDPDELWRTHNGQVADGENVRWTLARCSDAVPNLAPVYDEGRRFEITSTAIERNPRARQACLDHHGYSCDVCKFNFEDRFGEIGRGYIHVHHRVDISFRKNSHHVDPVLDLIPLCPNCHAMAHATRPATSTDELKRLRLAQSHAAGPGI